jgi:hypothetical protein
MKAGDATKQSKEVNDHFGLCPKCKDGGEYVNIERNHYFFCRKCKTA